MVIEQLESRVMLDALVADANDDNRVDTRDFGILCKNFAHKTTKQKQAGDFNCDGIVNALDFNILATNFGSIVITCNWLNTEADEDINNHSNWDAFPSDGDELVFPDPDETDWPTGSFNSPLTASSLTLLGGSAGGAHTLHGGNLTISGTTSITLQSTNANVTLDSFVSLGEIDVTGSGALVIVHNATITGTLENAASLLKLTGSIAFNSGGSDLEIGGVKLNADIDLISGVLTGLGADLTVAGNSTLRVRAPGGSTNGSWQQTGGATFAITIDNGARFEGDIPSFATWSAGNNVTLAGSIHATGAAGTGTLLENPLISNATVTCASLAVNSAVDLENGGHLIVTTGDAYITHPSGNGDPVTIEIQAGSLYLLMANSGFETFTNSTLKCSGNMVLLNTTAGDGADLAGTHLTCTGTGKLYILGSSFLGEWIPSGFSQEIGVDGGVVRVPGAAAFVSDIFTLLQDAGGTVYTSMDSAFTGAALAAGAHVKVLTALPAALSQDTINGGTFAAFDITATVDQATTHPDATITGTYAGFNPAFLQFLSSGTPVAGSAVAADLGDWSAPVPPIGTLPLGNYDLRLSENESFDPFVEAGSITVVAAATGNNNTWLGLGLRV